MAHRKIKPKHAEHVDQAIAKDLKLELEVEALVRKWRSRTVLLAIGFVTAFTCWFSFLFGYPWVYLNRYARMMGFLWGTLFFALIVSLMTALNFSNYLKNLRKINHDDPPEHEDDLIAPHEGFEPPPRPDAEDEAASEKEIEGDRCLGEHPADRTAALARARRLATTMTVASMLISGWGWVYPRPYRLVILILIALPWVGIEVLRRSKGLFRVDKRPNDEHPTVAYALLAPSAVLMIRSVLDYNVYQSVTAFVLYALISAILVLAAARFDRTLWADKFSFTLVFLLALPYGYGVVTQANALLDRSTGTTYSAIVLRKHVSYGRRRVSHDLVLSPWGRETEPNGLRVSPSDYDAVQCGDTALLVLKRGALGLEWYDYAGTAPRVAAPAPCE